MNACTECGSFAINHHRHGRDGSDGHLCDVCYWRARAKSAICIGPPLISILAKDGQWTGSDGRGVVAADGLFQQDPYERIGQLERELNEANSGNWYGAGISIATELALAGRKPEDIVDAVKGLVRELNEAKQELASIYSSSEAEALAEANASSIRLLSMLDESHAREAQLKSALADKAIEIAGDQAFVNLFLETRQAFYESLRREAQLRAALEGIYSTACNGLIDTENYWMEAAEKALSLPPPPIVPVEDVKPLVEALSKIVKEQFYPMSKRLMTDASIAETALTNFTAKHKLL